MCPSSDDAERRVSSRVRTDVKKKRENGVS